MRELSTDVIATKEDMRQADQKVVGTF